MATYTIHIAGEHPLWPDLLKYNGVQHKHRSAAFRKLWKAMYEAFHGDGALDTERAWKAMAWVEEVEAYGLRVPGRVASHETARFTFTISREG